MLVAKSKLNSIAFLISKTLIGSAISHNEFVLKKTMSYNERNERRHQKFKELNQT